MSPTSWEFEGLLTLSVALQIGDLNMCLRSLEYSLELSAELQDPGRDSDVLGEMADVYTDMGDLEKAGQASCIVASLAMSTASGTAQWIDHCCQHQRWQTSH